MWRAVLLGSAIAALALVFAACDDDDNGGNGPETLTVITHDSFNITDTLLKEFEQKNNATVKLLPKGDAGAMLTSVILEKNNPEGDVVFGVDNTFLSRALQAGIFEPYVSPELDNVPGDLREGIGDLVTPIDYGYVNLNYDIAALQAAKLDPPKTLEELTDPRWKGKVVVENPASSSPGLAFLIATVDYFGADHYLDWWKQMRDNGLVVVDGWETAYNTNFTLYGGQQPIVLSYATSPAYEQMFAEPARDDSPTGNILPNKGAFKQVEYAGVIHGTPHQALARKFIDFLLSQQVQEDVPAQMAVYPADSKAAVPEAFDKFSKVTSEPAHMTPDEIAKGRDGWIEAWTNAVLR